MNDRVIWRTTTLGIFAHTLRTSVKSFEKCAWILHFVNEICRGLIGVWGTIVRYPAPWRRLHERKLSSLRSATRWARVVNASIERVILQCVLHLYGYLHFCVLLTCKLECYRTFYAYSYYSRENDLIFLGRYCSRWCPLCMSPPPNEGNVSHPSMMPPMLAMSIQFHAPHSYR